MDFLAPVTLTGRLVSLTPLVVEDAPGLAAASADGDLSLLPHTTVPAPEDMGRWVQQCLERQGDGTFLPLVTRRLDTGSIIGMTTYCNAEPEHRRLEIGYTWNARSAQRTGTNTESKLLLLTHAFETLGCIAVELRTHRLNEQSRRAIERLGAHQDGVLRHHRRLPDGSLRDTVVYSIVAPEWRSVRAGLRRRLDA